MNVLPNFGIRRPLDGRFQVLVIERIPPFSVEMVYSTAHWWQKLSSHNISVVNISPLPVFGGLPESLDLRAFDAVILFPRLGYDPLSLQFLDARLPTKFKDYDGVKILMRQDEHVLTNFIAKFVLDNDFDVLLSCVPEEQVSVAYPGLANSGVLVKSMLTGYVTPDMRNPARRPHSERPVDIFYRAYRGPLSGGQLVFDKWRIGRRVQELSRESDIRTDISLDRADRLVGHEWLARLEDSRAVLATESGSNVFDFDGEIYRWDQRRTGSGLEEPEDFEEAYRNAVEQKIGRFEGNVLYGQISPRHFEAAATKTLQVMFPGRYSDIFLKDRHYLELASDFGNWYEILGLVKDSDLVTEITERVFDEVVMNRDYWIETLIESLDGLLTERLEKRLVGSLPRRQDRSGSPCLYLYSAIGHRDTGSGTEVGSQRPENAIGLKFRTAARKSKLGAVLGEGDDSVEPEKVNQTDPGKRSVDVLLAEDELVPEELVGSAVGRSRSALMVRSALQLSLFQLEDELGAIAYPDYPIESFVHECQVALAIANRMEDLDVSDFSSVVVGDPLTLVALSTALAVPAPVLYVDFDRYCDFVENRPGWQAFFWLTALEAHLKDHPSTGAIATSEVVANRVKALSPNITVRASAKDDQAPAYSSDEELKAIADRLRYSTSRQDRPQAEDVASFRPPDLDLAAGKEILSLCQEMFGLDSTRYWVQLVNMCKELRSVERDSDDAVGLLLHGLRTYFERLDEQACCEVEAGRIEEWLSRAPTIFASVFRDLPDRGALEIGEAVANGKIPVTPDNCVYVWKMILRLLKGDHEEVATRVMEVAIETALGGESSDEKMVSGSLWGLNGVLEGIEQLA